MLNGVEVEAACGCSPGSLGPLDLAVPVIADHAVLAMADFVCGANKPGFHLRGVNWDRDLPTPAAADLRNAIAGDISPSGKGLLKIARGIEVGQIFELGTKYSESMNATVLDQDGKPRYMPMGCYGIGVTRVVAAAIEQNHDDRGILWPRAISPFDIVLIPLNMDKSERVKEISESLYRQLIELGIDVLLDDRPQRPGFKFADADLIGIPHRIVIAERGIESGMLEYKARAGETNEDIPLDAALAEIQARLSA
jgi:prolyl-tRNA synthetase